MRFEKWQALGNDYLILERDELPFELTPARVRRLCEGHFGVFADGVLLLSRARDSGACRRPAHLQPRRLGGRAVGQRRARGDPVPAPRGWTEQDEFSIHTAAGTIRPTITGPDTCRVDMGRASLRPRTFPAARRMAAGQRRSRRGRTWRFQHVSIGNPQCAIHVGPSRRRWQRSIWPRSGRRSKATQLFPNRTNVSWYTEIGDRDGDDGTGRTGRAASARGSSSAGSGRRSPRAPAPRARRSPTLLERRGPAAGGARVTVVLDGGELEVEVGEDLRVHLTGWARPVFAGRLSEDFVKELHETE